MFWFIIKTEGLFFIYGYLLRSHCVLTLRREFIPGRLFLLMLLKSLECSILHRILAVVMGIFAFLKIIISSNLWWIIYSDRAWYVSVNPVPYIAFRTIWLIFHYIIFILSILNQLGLVQLSILGLDTRHRHASASICNRTFSTITNIEHWFNMLILIRISSHLFLRKWLPVQRPWISRNSILISSLQSLP